MLAIAILVLSVPLCFALEFEMTRASKCIVEQINQNVVVVGDYQLLRRDGQTVDGTVTVCS